MPYAVRYLKRAREELNACAALLGPHGRAFLESVEHWLQELADEAERNETGLSENATEFLERYGAIIPERLIPKEVGKSSALLANSDPGESYFPAV